MRSPAEMRRVRDSYWAARRRGFDNSTASRIVGVHRRQGTRWLQEANRFGVPRPRSTSARYLSLAERERIADGLRQGLSIRAIAAELQRAPSTVSREVRRNGGPVRGRYGPFAADRFAEARARRPKRSKVERHPPLLRFIRGRLGKRWSPVQISQALRREFGDDERMQACPETIYQAIYVQGRGQLRRELASARGTSLPLSLLTAIRPRVRPRADAVWPSAPLATRLEICSPCSCLCTVRPSVR